MKTTLRIALLLSLAFATLVGCAADEAPYDPDFDANEPTAGGKADGIFDIIPAIAFGDTVTGTLEGDDVEFYRIRLRRTDDISISMSAEGGAFNPHVSVYYGSSTYVSSDSFDLDGDTVNKVYRLDSEGVYLIAARVYRNNGGGDYSLTLTCNDGPCAGNFPEPVSLLDVDAVATCIEAAHECAFAALPAYEGRVGAARSNQIFQECLNEGSTDEGESCSEVCEWENPDEERDTARSLCDTIIEDLPFYADQSAECHAEVFSCMSDCTTDPSAGDWDTELWYSGIGNCWEGVLNGDCDSYARDSEACGGNILAGSAGECEDFCESTIGAWTDDISDICGRDSDCDDYCDVDIAAAGEECGAVSAETQSCYSSWFDDHNAWVCEGVLEDMIE